MATKTTNLVTPTGVTVTVPTDRAEALIGLGYKKPQARKAPAKRSPAKKSASQDQEDAEA